MTASNTEARPADHLKAFLRPAGTVSFSDISHQFLMFDRSKAEDRLILELLEDRWVQRLRSVRQTGNTLLVYMYAEHSRFGHSLAVAYLAELLMNHLSRDEQAQVERYKPAVLAAALLHDVGHVAPGSHLAEVVWSRGKPLRHEHVTTRIIEQSDSLPRVLESYRKGLTQEVTAVLTGHLPEAPWTTAVLAGDGWNADRGNWAILDSAMCAVSYGRYNVPALIDAFRLTPEGQLVLLESRLDALTHFFLARDSMYRQVYQHRVLQAADALTAMLVVRLRDMASDLFGTSAVSAEESAVAELVETFNHKRIFCDRTMARALLVPSYTEDLELDEIFGMTESWWRYHVEQWCGCSDPILADLSTRYRDRRLFKTVRLPVGEGVSREAIASHPIVERARSLALREGFDPRYYVTTVTSHDKHRKELELPPKVLLDTGDCIPVTEVEPLIAQLFRPVSAVRAWLVVPQKIKELLGAVR